MQTFISNNRYDIKTPYGWEPFEGIVKTSGETDTLIIGTHTGKSIRLTLSHRLLLRGQEVIAESLMVGDELETTDGFEEIVSIEQTSNQEVYDIFNTNTHTILANNFKSKQCDELAFAGKKTSREMWSAVFPTLSCLAPDTYILTSNGFERIQNHFNGDEDAGTLIEYNGNVVIHGMNGLEPISHSYVSPGSKTLIFTTRSGYKVEVTEDHPLYGLSNYHGGMKPARDIQVGEYLRCDVGMNVFGVNNINTNDAYLLGLYLAEGWYNKNSTRDSQRMFISSGDDEIHTFLRDVYGFTGPYRDTYKMSKTCKQQFNRMISYGIEPSQKAHNKIIPEYVMRSDYDTQMNVVGGMYDGDGSITDRGITYSSTSREMISQLKLLLANLGIITRVYETDEERLLKKEIDNNRLMPQGKTIKSLRKSYNLIVPLSQTKKFMDNVRIRLSRKIKSAKELILKHNQDDFKQFKVPSTVFLRNHIRTSLVESGLSEYYCRKKGVRFDKLETCKSFTNQWLDRIKNIGIKHSIETGSYFWDEIVSIEESYQEVTYDFTVPNSHSFLQNGIMGSNTGGKCIVTSTPSDDETLFAELWLNATKTIDEHGNDTDVGINGFKALKVKWDEHPERDETYKKLQIAQFGEEKFRREHELEFISMEETLIDPVMLSTYEGIEPISKTGKIRWYAPIDKEKIYVIGYDPSLGTGRDNSAIVVYEFPSMVQVGEWIHNKSDVPAQIRILKKILDMFRDAGFDEDNVFWSLENNTIGEAPLVMIKHEIGEDEFFGTFMKEKKRRGSSRVRGGFLTDHTEKMKACNRFKIWFEQGKMKVNSKALIAELKGFVAQGRTYKARAGDTDDIVMATLLVVRMVEIIMQDEEEYLEELGVTASNLFDDIDDDDEEGWGAPMPML